MDRRLEKALDFSNYQHSLSLKRRTLKETMNSKLIYGYKGGLFKIDRTLISFVQMLIDIGRSENIPLMDENDNPILIEDLNKFRDDILERYFLLMFEYHEEYQKIKNNRSVEKLVDL